MQYGAIPTSLLERIALATGAVPVPILDTLYSIMKSRVIMAGVSLGIFESLHRSPATAADLAKALRLDPDALDLLLRTLVLANYLRFDRGTYSLSRLAERTMVNGAQMPLTGFVEWNYTQWDMVARLESLVRTGQGVDFHSTLVDPDAWGHYQRAMLDSARFQAPTLAKRVPVRAGATRLLDVGGSHGLMGAAICRRHPPMRSVVLELPQAIDHARSLAREAGHADLVEHRAADALTDDLGEGYDVVLLSNILHHFTPAQCLALVAKIRRALVPGGTIAIWEIERPRRDQPPGDGDGAALFFRLSSTAATYHGDVTGRVKELAEERSLNAELRNVGTRKRNAE